METIIITGLLITLVVLAVMLSMKSSAINKLIIEYTKYKDSMDRLKKYSHIVDVEAEASKILSQANQTLTDSREKSLELKKKAEYKLEEANSIASKIESAAILNAKEIAGDAYIAKENAEHYEATVKAMKNIIKGYGDEYMVPNRSVLDDLAEEYNHKEAGNDLQEQRTLIKSMIKNDEVADCDYVEAYRRTTAIEFVLDAYNGKVDTIMSKVKRDNYGKLTQQLEDAFRLVNHNGKAFRNARITNKYHQMIVEQLRLSVAVQELKSIDQEEQRRIKEQIRDEERARREYEKAIKDAEKEEKLLQKAMVEAQKQLQSASDDERSKYEEKLRVLEEQLILAEAKGQRAMSMAQLTKTGHVYVISNVGSFGENIFKIGMTRRLEPHDRVKELGDASVPFSFDVHAMIQSDDAPKLEKKLHKLFQENQVNKVNSRKEFFNISLEDIKEVVIDSGFKAHWTMKAEALEYRQTIQLETRQDKEFNLQSA